MSSKLPPLGDLEHELLTILWAGEEMTAAAVRGKVRRKLQDATIRTVLRRLEDKGYVTHAVESGTFIYRPKESAESAAADALKGILSTASAVGRSSVHCRHWWIRRWSSEAARGDGFASAAARPLIPVGQRVQPGAGMDQPVLASRWAFARWPLAVKVGALFATAISLILLTSHLVVR